MSSLVAWFRDLDLLWKINLLVGLIIFLMCAGVLYFIQWQTQEILDDNLALVLDQATQNVAEDAALNYQLEDWAALREQGQTLLDSENLPVAMVYFQNDTGQVQAVVPEETDRSKVDRFQSNQVTEFRLEGRTVLGKQVPVVSDGNELGSLGLALSGETNAEKVSGVLWWSASILFVSGLVGLGILSWLIVSIIVKPLHKKATAISDGNLSKSFHDGIEVGGCLGEVFEQMVDDLRELFRTVGEAAQQTADTADLILNYSNNLKELSDKQSQQMQEASSAVTELSQSIEEVANNTRRANESSQGAREEAQRGGEAVRKAIQQMDEIEENVMSTADQVRQLGESGEEIGKIVDVISQIAEQTSLLSLNAAIEAARAGEQGKGFAVVADEVSRLADRVGQSADEIEELIDNIQKQTAASVESMETGTEKVKQGAEVVDEAGDALDQIIQSVDDTVEKNSQITTAMKEQTTASDEVADSVEQVNQASQDVVENAEDLVNEGQNLESIAEKMEELTERFTVGDDHGGGR